MHSTVQRLLGDARTNRTYLDTAARDRDLILAFEDDGSYTAWQSSVIVSTGTFSTQAHGLTWETDSYCEPGKREKGYISIDGQHPSGLGQQYAAELLAQMGYEPVTLP